MSDKLWIPETKPANGRRVTHAEVFEGMYMESDVKAHERAVMASGGQLICQLKVHSGTTWAGPEEAKLWDFRKTWDALNAKRGHSWESNPWVWAVSFRRIEE